MIYHSSFDRVLCFRDMVASIVGNNRDLVLGVAAASLCLVCNQIDLATQRKVQKGSTSLVGYTATRLPTRYVRICTVSNVDHMYSKQLLAVIFWYTDLKIQTDGHPPAA